MSMHAPGRSSATQVTALRSKPLSDRVVVCESIKNDGNDKYLSEVGACEGKVQHTSTVPLGTSCNTRVTSQTSCQGIRLSLGHHLSGGVIYLLVEEQHAKARRSVNHHPSVSVSLFVGAVTCRNQRTLCGCTPGRLVCFVGLTGGRTVPVKTCPGSTVCPG